VTTAATMAISIQPHTVIETPRTSPA